MSEYNTYEEYIKTIKNLNPSYKCPMKKTLSLFTGKWRVYVLFELSKHDSRRFGELKSAITGITNTMLTSTLRDLVELSIVSRKQFNEVPPHVEYSLTDKGRALFPIFDEIIKWNEKYQDCKENIE
ncbi:winged helix-turn-helix transcriptional regulator [Clostridium paraputrificum]|uniref:winged helix-turn-helix transcriptional regulator n=1 Tax=Clostridium paraputrificum TaxID=29363 RepID=UPI003D3320A6